MKITTAPKNISPKAVLNSATAATGPEIASVNRLATDSSAEEVLTNRIFQGGNGKNLIKFCRELSSLLIGSYCPNDEIEDLREQLCSSLVATLECSEKQARSLVELSLELIHAKLHGSYRRTDVQLSYLIATATGAVNDVSSN